jgi:hypothetical protein
MIGHLPAVAGSVTGTDDIRDSLGDLPLSFLSFRSHAEAFLATCRDPSDARAAMERRYQTVGPVVERKVSSILANVRDGLAPGGAAVWRGWHDATAAAKPMIAGRFAAGDIATVAPPDTDHRSAAAEFAANEFHGTLGQSGDLLRFLGTDPDFLAARLLTSLLYLSLHNIGVALVERYFLCYAVSRACESLFGVDAVDLLVQLVG